MNDEKWFAAKTIFRWKTKSGLRPPGDTLYEERVNLIRARDLPDAVKRGEILAEQYALDHADYLGFISVYEVIDDIVDGAEVYSLIRSSTLGPDDFVTHYFNDGTGHNPTITDEEPDTRQ